MGATAAWNVRSVAEPSVLAASDAGACELEEGKCDAYQLLLANVGDASSGATVTLTDQLPPGITTRETPVSGHDSEGVEWACTEGAGNASVTCTFADPVPAGGYAPSLAIRVSAPASSDPGTVTNEVHVTGGGGAETASSEQTPVNSEPSPFEVSELGMAPMATDGTPADDAAGHPWELTTNFGIPSHFAPPGSSGSVFGGALEPVENLKSVAIRLPPGFVGNPQSVPQCTESQLRAEECPSGSRVGTFAVIGDGGTATFQFSEQPGRCCSAIYNISPEGGYPAELGFTYLEQTILLYASVVHDNRGYRVRVTDPGIPSILETADAVITIFGDPTALDGTPGEDAFLTNPANCSGTPLYGEAELTSWTKPESPVSAAANAYPELAHCQALTFAPSFDIGPVGDEGAGKGATADKPEAYTANLTIPQSRDFAESATPELRTLTVTLPEGIAISPPAAEGLVGCDAEGPSGINIGSGEVGGAGRDLRDPEATELGVGHRGGNHSPYDDGFFHTAPGHCPPASAVGSVRVTSPLLKGPLFGHLYLAAPSCGAEGQTECSEASATNGELFGLYMEVGGPNGEHVEWEGERARPEDSGVIVKLKGTVSAAPQTGQLKIRFAENPQLPVGEVKVHTRGGPRAPLANPQACGTFTATSDLVPWSAPGTPDASPPGRAFSIGGCTSPTPFAPRFAAGTERAVAAAVSPFTMALTRDDGEQDFSGVATTLPSGLVGVVASVPECVEAQANAGTCPESSLIGSTSVTAGSGSDPYAIAGRVYLTGPYGNAPFGLSIVVPAKAGPFNLGDVIVRASINIDPNTAVVIVTSGQLPQMRDGVPFRVKTINITIDRPGFILNPTNCESHAITGVITGTQGASAAVSSPFAVAGCQNLQFKPTLTAATQGHTSKVDGASLNVKVTYPASGEANIRATSVELPTQLPSRLTTLQKACLAATFAANPASCPAGSAVGTARAVTPVLPVALEGPAYLVSHGGEAFPDLVIVLQGDGVTVYLTGKTDIKKGITSSTFSTVPDEPVTSFELNLPEQKNSVFSANANLCAATTTKRVRRHVPLRRHGHLVRRHGRTVMVVKEVTENVPIKLVMPTTITGQNGATIHQKTAIAVKGCARLRRETKRKGKSPKKPVRGRKAS
jgi:hypothetical protein